MRLFAARPNGSNSGRFFVAVWLTFFLAFCSQAQWTVVSLHPAGADHSFAYGAQGNQQVGEIIVGGMHYASLWIGTAASQKNLHPAGATYSIANGAGGGQQVGEFVTESNARHAGLWSGTSGSIVDLHPAGSANSAANGLSGNRQAGWVMGSGEEHASIWSGTAASWIDIHPAGAIKSEILGIDVNQQAGYILEPEHLLSHASLWKGTASSWVDLHPSTAQNSEARGVGGDQQVGWTSVPNGSSYVQHASLWSGTAASWVDLNPNGATSSLANAAYRGLQVGAAKYGGSSLERAKLWLGTAASCVDLHDFLPSEFIGSIATGISSDGSFIYIVGYGFNDAMSRVEALLWIAEAPPRWTVVNLHPPGASESRANGTDGIQQVGYASTNGRPKEASLWSGSASSWISLHPTAGDYTMSTAFGVEAGVQVGSAHILGRDHASLWRSAPDTISDFNQGIHSAAYAISGDQIVGYQGGDNGRASLWLLPNCDQISLGAGTVYSFAVAAADGQQVGWNGGPHACYWTGVAWALTEMRPLGSTSSRALGVSNGIQCGEASFGGSPHAGIWASSGASWLDINPANASSSSASCIRNGIEAGYAEFGSARHAGLWHSTADSWEDLHFSLPSEFTSSAATGMAIRGGSIYIVGYGFNSLTNRDEALMWISPNEDWISVNLHPAGAAESRAFGIDEAHEVGLVKVSGNDHASLWTGTSSLFLDLNPGGISRSIARAVSGESQAGLVFVNGQPRAAKWDSSPGSFTALSSLNSLAFGVAGAQQAGTEEDGNSFHASLWTGTPESQINLSPGEAEGVVNGTSDGTQVGYVIHPSSGGVHRACLWQGSAASRINLSPPDDTGSDANGVSAGQQVGYVSLSGVQRASLWYGTALSRIDLHPSFAEDSNALAVGNGTQVGFVRVSGVERACVWNGSAESLIDLHGTLPPSFSESQATGVWSGDTFTRVCGYGFNTATNRYEALLWIRTRPLWTVTYLNPAGATESHAYGVQGDKQVGDAAVGGVVRASLWNSSPGLWTDLSPAGSTNSCARAIDGTHQAGAATFNNQSHAMLWSGTPSSVVDLNPVPGYDSSAFGVSGDKQVGRARNYTTDPHAALWRGNSATYESLDSTSFTSVAFGISGTQQVGYTITVFPEVETHAALWNGSASSKVDLNPAGATGSTAWGPKMVIKSATPLSATIIMRVCGPIRRTHGLI